MNDVDQAPPGLDPAVWHRMLVAAQTEVATALWLSAGMIFAVAMIVFLAASLRRCALFCGLLYAITVCFVPVGHARVLGPCGASAAAVGLVWPRRRTAPAPR